MTTTTTTTDPDPNPANMNPTPRILEGGAAATLSHPFHPGQFVTIAGACYADGHMAGYRDDDGNIHRYRVATGSRSSFYDDAGSVAELATRSSTTAGLRLCFELDPTDSAICGIVFSPHTTVSGHGSLTWKK